MEIWLDTIDLAAIRHAHSLELLQGVTTNPLLLAEAPESIFNDLLSNQEGPIAVQLTEKTRDKMLQQARQISKASSRFIVKVPACQEGYFVIEELAEEGIPVMATAIFEPTQAFLAFKLGAHYLAPYLGRVADENKDPSDLLRRIRAIKLAYEYEGNIIAAGIRSLEHIYLALEHSCEAITLPKKVYEQFISTPPSAERALEDFHAAAQKMRSKLLSIT